METVVEILPDPELTLSDMARIPADSGVEPTQNDRDTTFGAEEVESVIDNTEEKENEWLNRFVRKKFPRLENIVYEKFMETESEGFARKLKEEREDRIPCIALSYSWIKCSDDSINNEDSGEIEDGGREKGEEEEDMEGMEVSQEVIARVKKKKKRAKKKGRVNAGNSRKASRTVSIPASEETSNIESVGINSEHIATRKESRVQAKASSVKNQKKNLLDLIAEVAEMEKRDLGITDEEKPKFRKIFHLESFDDMDLIKSRTIKYVPFIMLTLRSNLPRDNGGDIPHNFCDRNYSYPMIDKPWIGTLLPKILMQIFYGDDLSEVKLFQKMSLCKLETLKRRTKMTGKSELEMELNKLDPLVALVTEVMAESLVETENEVKLGVPEEWEPYLEEGRGCGEAEVKILEERLLHWLSTTRFLWETQQKQLHGKLPTFTHLLKKWLASFAMVCAVLEQKPQISKLWEKAKRESPEQFDQLMQTLQEAETTTLIKCQDLCSLYLLPRLMDQEQLMVEELGKGLNRLTPRLVFLLSNEASSAIPKQPKFPASIRNLLVLLSLDISKLVHKFFTNTYASSSEQFSRPAETRDVLGGLAGILMRFRRSIAKKAASLYPDFDGTEVQRSLGLVEYSAGVVQNLSDLFRTLTLQKCIMDSEVWDTLEDRSLLDSAEQTLLQIRSQFQKVEFDMCKPVNRHLLAEFMMVQEDLMLRLEKQIRVFLETTARHDPGVVKNELHHFAHIILADFTHNFPIVSDLECVVTSLQPL